MKFGQLLSFYGKFTEVKLTQNAQVLAENNNIWTVAGFEGNLSFLKLSVNSDANRTFNIHLRVHIFGIYSEVGFLQ